MGVAGGVGVASTVGIAVKVEVGVEATVAGLTGGVKPSGTGVGGEPAHAANVKPKPVITSQRFIQKPLGDSVPY